MTDFLDKGLEQWILDSKLFWTLFNQLLKHLEFISVFFLCLWQVSKNLDYKFSERNKKSLINIHKITLSGELYPAWKNKLHFNTLLEWFPLLTGGYNLIDIHGFMLTKCSVELFSYSNRSPTRLRARYVYQKGNTARFKYERIKNESGWCS